MPKRKADDGVNDEVVSINKSSKRKAQNVNEDKGDIMQKVAGKKLKVVSSEDVEMHSPSLKMKKKKKKKKKKNKGKAKEDGSNEDCKDSELDSGEVTSTSQKKTSKSKGFVLFVGQIPHHITKKDIERHFAEIGGVKDVRLLIYPDSGRSRGCAYVEFDDQKHRTAAFKLNESMLGGAKIHVEFPYQGGKKYQKNGKQKGKRKP